MQALRAGQIQKRLVDGDRLRSAASAPASISRTSRPPPPRIFSMFGLMMTASGQAASALNIGMAERTPLMRANVAGGGHHATPPAADDHGLVLSIRDCRVFRIAA